jgi:hypothetical protein
MVNYNKLTAIREFELCIQILGYELLIHDLNYMNKLLDPRNYQAVHDFGLEVALFISRIPPAQNVSYLQ